MADPRHKITVTVRIEDDRLLPGGVDGINAMTFAASFEGVDVLEPDEVGQATQVLEHGFEGLLDSAFAWARAEREP